MAKRFNGRDGIGDWVAGTALFTHTALPVDPHTAAGPIERQLLPHPLPARTSLALRGR